jgi:hypothetical protein
VVEQSTPQSQTNKAVLYGGPDGWEWREWKGFLNRFFKPVKGIRKFHHFTLDADKPGKPSY